MGLLGLLSFIPTPFLLSLLILTPTLSFLTLTLLSPLLTATTLLTLAAIIAPTISALAHTSLNLILLLRDVDMHGPRIAPVMMGVV